MKLYVAHNTDHRLQITDSNMLGVGLAATLEQAHVRSL